MTSGWQTPRPQPSTSSDLKTRKVSISARHEIQKLLMRRRRTLDHMAPLVVAWFLDLGRLFLQFEDARFRLGGLRAGILLGGNFYGRLVI